MYICSAAAAAATATATFVKQVIYKIFCRSHIEKLEAEQGELTRDLKLIESNSNQARNEKACESLGELGRKKRMSSSFLSCTVISTDFTLLCHVTLA